MILSTGQLIEYAGKLVLVDGSFDPLHDGHIAYFRGASQLGFPVICNVAPDSWTRSKHQILLSQTRRGVVLDSIKYLSFVHLSEITTCEIIELLRPKIYVKGSDWIARGGVPQQERKVCDNLGIEIRYLDTILNSSTRLLAELQGPITVIERLNQ